RSVSARTVLATVKAIAESAAESQRTARRAVPLFSVSPGVGTRHAATARRPRRGTPQTPSRCDERGHAPRTELIILRRVARDVDWYRERHGLDAPLVGL